MDGMRTSTPTASPLPAAASFHVQQRLGRPARAGSVVELVGNTPLVRLGRIDKQTPGVEIWAKCEFANPGGSVKDRAALRIIQDALARGDLRPGVRLLDSTSGNTGIAYSLIGSALGIPISLVMPSNVSNPRKQVTAAFGTELIFSDPMEGSDGAIVHARELVDLHPERYYYPNQYANDSNWRGISRSGRISLGDFGFSLTCCIRMSISESPTKGKQPLSS